MTKSAIRSLVQAICVLAVLAALSIPLSSLMVEHSDASAPLAPAAAVQLDQAPSSSPVSALMAGSAVGPTRGGTLKPRHPASAYVP